VWIKSAEVQGYRNLKSDAFTFSPRVNIVLGRNGEGKTNFLEALNYFALGRSHRSTRSHHLIGFDKEALHVHLALEEESGDETSCEFGLDRSGERRFRLDGDIVKRRSDLVGKLVTVFFSPDSIQLVRGGPLKRRHFIDQGMSEIDPLLLPALTGLARVLKQKNHLLRSMKKRAISQDKGIRELKAWNKEMAVHATEVCLARMAYVQLLEPNADKRHEVLSDQNIKLQITYRPSLESVVSVLEKNPSNPPKKGDLEEEIFQEIDYISTDEIRRGKPLIGPQFDDFEIRHNNLDLRVFGSQGESRSAAIAMILARSDVLFEKRQVRPVIFFDDIFSELDRERTQRLQTMAAEMHQVFVATARAEDIEGWKPEQLKVWEVESGTLRRSERYLIE
jgi:DNA replication and repair protein RecF